jgi:hypothetical protein
MEVTNENSKNLAHMLHDCWTWLARDALSAIPYLPPAGACEPWPRLLRTWSRGWARCVRWIGEARTATKCPSVAVSPSLISLRDRVGYDTVDDTARRATSLSTNLAPIDPGGSFLGATAAGFVFLPSSLNFRRPGGSGQQGTERRGALNGCVASWGPCIAYGGAMLLCVCGGIR